jgi:hypothetical protein
MNNVKRAALLLPLLLPAPASADPMNPAGVTMATIEQAWKGHSYQATTAGAGVVSWGAIVCHALGGSEGDANRTTARMFEQVAEYTVSIVALPPNVRATLEAYGEPQPRVPDLEANGCIMMPTGQRVLVANWYAFPWIAAEVDGRVIVGATLPDMIKRR